jgi:hypothetical protein
MPERSLLDILAIVNFWTQWARHFGPLSGSAPKLADLVQRYILTAFTFGCNLGPAQAARPIWSHHFRWKPHPRRIPPSPDVVAYFYTYLSCTRTIADLRQSAGRFHG